MKKQIVITLTEENNTWKGEIHGKVDRKNTTGIETTKKYPCCVDVLDVIAHQTNLIKIEKWMEQIA